jgi:hypothetical protein
MEATTLEALRRLFRISSACDLLFRPQEGISRTITGKPCSTVQSQMHFSRPVLTKQSTAFLHQAFIAWWRGYVYHFPAFIPFCCSTGRSSRSAIVGTRWLKTQQSIGQYAYHTTPFGGRPSHVNGMSWPNLKFQNQVVERPDVQLPQDAVPGAEGSTVQ